MPSQFYNTVFHLRQAEEIILYDRLLVFTPEDDELVKDLLKIEYETESPGYPFAAPAFDAAAALWGAKTIYTACQLVLYRENKTAELPELLPPYKGDINASAMVSVDLCLRFLPEVISSARNIDPEDSLVEIIENLLTQWHYSGIGHPLKNKITGLPCLAPTAFAVSCCQLKCTC